MKSLSKYMTYEQGVTIIVLLVIITLIKIFIN